MSQFDHLKELVQTGKLRIIYELSLPRSNSTAWQIAIAQAPEVTGQINEPSFHSDFKVRKHDEISDPARSFEVYCEKIIARAKTLSESTSDDNVTLVVNDLVHSVSAEELKKILELTDDIVITVRDPRVQGLSCLTRIINDSLDSLGGGNISLKLALELANKLEFTDEELADLKGPGKNKFNPDRILELLELPKDMAISSEILQKAISHAVTKTSHDYIEICWNNMKAQLDIIRTAKSDVRLVIVDGAELLQHPQEVMKKSAEILGLTYTQDMVDHWVKSVGEDFYCSITQGWGDLAFTNHWNGPVRSSSGIEYKPNNVSTICDISEFPASMHESLTGALLVYNDIMGNC
jgi:hypothetical protein